MSEAIITIGNTNPLDIFGIQDKNISHLRELFPKLKIVARDQQILVIGPDEDLNNFTNLIDSMIIHLDKYGKLDIDEINLLNKYGNSSESISNENIEKSDFLVHGRSGAIIRARTINQQKMVESISKNDMVFAVGPAGTGKTYTAVALAVRALKNKEVKRIILTRPAVEAGESLGFLPGDLKDKLDPYLRPLYDALQDMLPSSKLKSYIDEGVIEIAPLAFMRGRTLEKAFVILDEAQNCTISQLKLFLTRMGKMSKFIITGDITQIDLPVKQKSGLIIAKKTLNHINGIDFIDLDNRDVVRHRLVTDIIDAFSDFEKKEENSKNEDKNKTIK